MRGVPRIVRSEFEWGMAQLVVIEAMGEAAISTCSTGVKGFFQAMRVFDVWEEDQMIEVHIL